MTVPRGLMFHTIVRPAEDPPKPIHEWFIGLYTQMRLHAQDKWTMAGTSYTFEMMYVYIYIYVDTDLIEKQEGNVQLI